MDMTASNDGYSSTETDTPSVRPARKRSPRQHVAKLSAYDTIVIDVVKATLRGDHAAAREKVSDLKDAELRQLDTLLTDMRTRVRRDHGRRLAGE